MAGAEAIRDVIAFPKTQRGQDLRDRRAVARHRAPAARAAHPPAEHDAAVRLVAGLLALVFSFSAFVFFCRRNREKAAAEGSARNARPDQEGRPVPPSARRRRLRQPGETAAGARARLVPRVHRAHAGREGRAARAASSRAAMVRCTTPTTTTAASGAFSNSDQNTEQAPAKAERCFQVRRVPDFAAPTRSWTPRAAARCTSRASISPARPPRRR